MASVASVMTDRVLLDCLERNRRVALPGLGAFVRSQGDDKVVFTALVTGDDGVLAAELHEARGLGRKQAGEAVQEYIGAIRTEVATRGEYVIAGLGAIYADENEVFRLDYNPEAVATPRGEDRVAGAKTDAAPRGTAQPERADSEQSESKKTLSDWKKGLPDIYAQGATSKGAPVADGAEVAEADEAGTPKKSGAEGMEKVVAAQPEKAVAEEAGEQKRAEAEDPVLPKLQYQKPVRPEPTFERRGAKKRADTIMIIAIIAALIAIGAMLYGILHSPSPVIDFKNVRSTIQAPAQQVAPK